MYALTWWPTESGPTVTWPLSASRTRDPPPKPIETRSGIEKLIKWLGSFRTRDKRVILCSDSSNCRKKVRKFEWAFEAPLMNDAACRGKPLGSNTPTSVVVPPTSTTITLFLQVVSPNLCQLDMTPHAWDLSLQMKRSWWVNRAASAAIINVLSF